MKEARVLVCIRPHERAQRVTYKAQFALTYKRIVIPQLKDS